MTKTLKAKRGRPIQGDEARTNHSIMLEPKEVEFLKKIGCGNVSQGVRFAMECAKINGH